MSTAKSGKLITNNNSSPLVTIIIPVYNGSNFLAEAIDSALAQTYKNFEIIVVNDGSTDNGKTENVAKCYGSKIRYFYKDNGGVSSALNFGIKKAKGDWISWLSHDDIYFPDKLERQIEYVDEHSKAKFICSYYINSDELEHGVNRIHSWKQNKSLPLPLQLLYSNPINGCTTLIHKECFEKAGLFNEFNKTAQDWEMWINLSLNYSFYLCPIIAVKRRIHREMGSKIMSRQQIIDILKTIKRKDPIVEKYLNSKINLSNEGKSALYLDWGDVYLKKGISELAVEKYKKALQLNKQIKYRLWLRKVFGSWWFPGFKINKLYWKLVTLKAKILK